MSSDDLWLAIRRLLLLSLAIAHGFSFAASASEIYESNRDSTVTVTAKGPSGAVVLGSGVVIAKRGAVVLIATNCHVVRGASAAQIRNQSADATADVLTCNEKADIAILRAPVSLRSVQRASSYPSVGARVYAIGSPRGLEMSMSQGIVSQIRVIGGDGRRLIQTTAAIEPGSSGGGLFDERGRLLGLTTSRIQGSQGLNFAIPVADLVEEMESLSRADPLVSPGSAPPGESRVGKFSVKGFHLGQHCSATSQAVAALKAEGLTMPTNTPDYCTESPRNPVWARFYMGPHGSVERKASVTLNLDDQGFIEGAFYQDYWFFNAREAPPVPSSLLDRLEARYGTPVAFKEVTSGVEPGLFAKPSKGRTWNFVFAAQPVDSSKIPLAESRRYGEQMLEDLSADGGDFVLASILYTEDPNGRPISVALRINMKRLPIRPPLPASPPLRF